MEGSLTPVELSEVTSGRAAVGTELETYISLYNFLSTALHDFIYFNEKGMKDEGKS